MTQLASVSFECSHIAVDIAYVLHMYRNMLADTQMDHKFVSRPTCTLPTS